jgi:hypothetical protein
VRSSSAARLHSRTHRPIVSTAAVNIDFRCSQPTVRYARVARFPCSFAWHVKARREAAATPECTSSRRWSGGPDATPSARADSAHLCGEQAQCDWRWSEPQSCTSTSSRSPIRVALAAYRSSAVEVAYDQHHARCYCPAWWGVGICCRCTGQFVLCLPSLTHRRWHKYWSLDAEIFEYAGQFLVFSWLTAARATAFTPPWLSSRVCRALRLQYPGRPAIVCRLSALPRACPQLAWTGLYRGH